MLIFKYKNYLSAKHPKLVLNCGFGNRPFYLASIFAIYACTYICLIVNLGSVEENKQHQPINGHIILPQSCEGLHACIII